MKEELKNKLTERFDKITAGECDNKDLRDALLKAYLAGGEYGYQYALQHPHWIPVEERVPEERGHYLVYSQFGDVWLSEWMQDKEGRWDWYVAPICVGIISKVTHWMPLPAAPRKEDKE